MEDSLFAYTLCQTADGWSWRLWDEVGAVVAAGEAPDQDSAQRGLKLAFEKTQADTCAPTLSQAARRRDRNPHRLRVAKTAGAADHWRSGVQAGA